MPQDATDTDSEPRTKVAGTRVTADEMRRIKVVAGLKDTSVSQLLRTMSVEDALAEFDQKSAA